MNSKIKKFTKVLLTIILTIATFVPANITANAASKQITLGELEVLPRYVAGVLIDAKKTTSGQYVYCVDNNKPTAKNTTANLVGEANAGVTAILNNGYPYKSITGDKAKDYYITQAAIWWYLDNTTGSSNLGTQFKSTGSDAYNLRNYIKNLVKVGEQAAKSYTTALTITTSDKNMTLSNGYYVSKSIKATNISNINSYTVSLKNAPSKTEIVNSKGEVVNSIAANDSFYIRIPANQVTSVSLNVTVTATGKSAIKKAYVYQPVNGMQNVTLLEDETKSSSLTLNLATSKVTIVKVDSKTGLALAGAKLVLKDSNGKQITSWTSTVNGHVVRNLVDGTYTVEEVSAPNGYELNKTPVKFTISGTNRDIKVKIQNKAKKVVVNITKIDASTKNPLSGAILVVKNSSGNIVARFTTTENSYTITDLENGTYTVEEEQAPAGYKASSEKISFTIDDEHLSHQIMFENYPEVEVPNTSSSSLIFSLLGIAIISIGIGFVYKNGQNA